MAPSAFHAHTDDPLGLATAGDIVLASLDIGNVYDRIEMLAETGFQIDDADVPLLLQKFSRQASIVYELKKATLGLVLPFGAVINTDWVIQQATVDYNSGAFPRVSLNVLELVAAASLAVHGDPGELTVVGGWGAVDDFDVTGSPQPVSSQFSIAFQTLEAMDVGANAGKFLSGGYLMWNWRKQYRLDSYTDFTPPATGHVTEAPVRTSREGWKIYSKSWYEYVTA
jgi:hypothetical protein